MLVVRVEMWPQGDFRHARPLATMTADILGCIDDSCDYDVRMDENGYDSYGIPKRLEKFEIREHDRNQSVWVLIAEAILRWQNPGYTAPDEDA